jgi:hypothetical protein
MIAYFFFLFGFIYYCVVPIVIINFFPGNKALDFVDFYNRSYVIFEYSFYALIFFILFSVGFFVKLKIKNLCEKKPNITRIFSVVLVVVYIVLFLNIFSFNEMLSIQGYSEGYDIGRRGQLSTLYLTSVWWYIYLQSGSRFNLIKNLFIIIIVLTGLNLLSLGSRLAFVTGIIMIFLNYRSNLFVNFKINKIFSLILLFGLGALFGAIGVFREGGELNFDAISFVIFAEPVFIFSSVFAYVNNVSIAYINFPYDVFTSLAASVPSFIFQDKIEFFSKYTVLPDSLQSGFGGANQIVILLANFGKILFPFVSLALGYAVALIVNKMNKTRFSYTFAIGVVALIPFIFFRDGYQTSLKLAVINFFVIPGLFLLCDKLIKTPNKMQFRYGVFENTTTV